MRTITILVLLFFSAFAMAQENFDGWLKKKEGAKLEPFAMVQLWSSYSIGQEVYNTTTGLYENVENRPNIQLRRARLGFRAEPYAGLKFTIVGAYDLLGRDVNTALVGGANNDNLPAFGIWDAFFQWKMKQGSEALNLVGGYFRPQLSRESITSGWSVNSMEKAMSQTYIRTQLVGRSPGRALGLNLGGLLQNKKLNYNVGIFNPLYQTNNSNSTGSSFSPLLVGRIAYSIGDPEMTNYKIGYDINYFGKRKGVTLAAGGSWQGATDLFERSYTAAFDMLLNYGPLNVDGEWNVMWRDGSRILVDQEVRDFTYQSGTGHIRAGYNVVVANKFFLEPSFMLMHFQGEKDTVNQADAVAVGASSGSETTYDAGINWYLNAKRLKIMLHYTWRTGDAGDAGDGARVNQFFSQSNVGAIRRGDWIGLGVNAIF